MQSPPQTKKTDLKWNRVSDSHAAPFWRARHSVDSRSEVATVGANHVGGNDGNDGVPQLCGVPVSAFEPEKLSLARLTQLEAVERATPRERIGRGKI